MRSIRPTTREGIATVEGHRLIESIHLRNLLSFGPDSEAFDLLPLNVLIGPNGSGKTNLIEALSVLQAAPRDLAVPFRRGGGAAEWSWKGGGDKGFARVSCALPLGRGGLHPEMASHELAFSCAQSGPLVSVEHATHGPLLDASEFALFHQHTVFRHRTEVRAFEEPWHEHDGSPDARTWESADRWDLQVPLDQSVLSQRWSPSDFPQLDSLARAYSGIAIYRDWTFGTDCPVRKAQPADLPGNPLLPDCSNLAHVLSGLLTAGLRRELLEGLRKVIPSITDINTMVHGGVIQFSFLEEGLSRPIPSTRLSDGTLRYLCLLAILLHPEPPPLVCIEEPELGLHPDIIPTIADLLKDASQRMQLVVTTHSDMLVSALSDVPEAIVVCERDDAGTHLRRLDPEPLRKWLDEYRLGDAWLSGHFGGVRF